MTQRAPDDRTVKMRPAQGGANRSDARRAASPRDSRHGAELPPGRAPLALFAGLALLVLAGTIGGYIVMRPQPAPAPVPSVASVPPPQMPAPPASVPLAPPQAPQAIAPQAVAPQAIAPAPSAPPVALPAPPAPTFPVQSADEATIASHVASTLTLFRFAANPRVLVLDFPTLLQQGLMLNRIAAMVEKAGLPHDRVLTDAELAAAIKAHGDTIETYYYGHDYPAADLAAFFARADRQAVTLDPQEELLRRILTEQGVLTPGSRKALISIPRIGEAGIDAVMRAAILEHELSHGEFFSNPDFAAYTRHFYDSVMPPAARDAFRAYLIREDYDPAQPDLIANETQAYLMNTSDPRLFNAAEVGLSEAELQALRQSFLAGMPAGWLRDRIAARLAHPYAPPPAAAAPAPRAPTTARQ